MIHKCFKSACLGAMMLGFALTGSAATISGGISLSGNVTYDSGDIDTATAFGSFDQVVVNSVSGSYATAGVLAGTTISMTAFQFAPFGSSVMPLWQTTSGSVLASFDLTSVTIVSQGGGFLALKGQGTLHLQGYDDTTGYWKFSSQQGDTTFSFSSSDAATTTSVPDGASTLTLVGLALSGLGVLRKHLA